MSRFFNCAMALKSGGLGITGLLHSMPRISQASRNSAMLYSTVSASNSVPHEGQMLKSFAG
jgi:hypothetical protein